MTAARPRSGDEIRAYLRTQVNHAVRRTGAYGGERALDVLFPALAHAEGVEDEWAAERQLWRAQGWWASTGIRGAIDLLLPDSRIRADDAVASVYAGYAYRAGWLAPDRLLTPAEYADLRAALPQWVAEDRRVSDVHRRFGPPSLLLGGGNPRYPQTYLYATDRFRPLLCLHLWNDFNEPLGDEPVLLVARQGGQPFGESFWFTPEGRRRCPVAAEA
ncbi:hypothetical protein ABZ570_05720 [Micromonospora sp. NPDC007271]|uniref:hypothetical protein n=1 Tax=Micromonospora sp. NPDC007271 TaxID=3154587 RepID=UPI0033C77C82